MPQSFRRFFRVFSRDSTYGARGVGVIESPRDPAVTPPLCVRCVDGVCVCGVSRASHAPWENWAVAAKRALLSLLGFGKTRWNVVEGRVCRCVLSD